MFDEDKELRRQEIREKGIAALDWQKLYDWTSTQPEGTVLGQSKTNTLDPLGHYLDKATGMQDAYWSIGPSIRNGYQDRIPKPQWVADLIKETDRTDGPLTREVYLEILERIKPV